MCSLRGQRTWDPVKVPVVELGWRTALEIRGAAGKLPCPLHQSFIYISLLVHGKRSVITISNYHWASTDTSVAWLEVPDVIGRWERSLWNTPEGTVPDPWCSISSLKHIFPNSSNLTVTPYKPKLAGRQAGRHILESLSFFYLAQKISFRLVLLLSTGDNNSLCMRRGGAWKRREGEVVKTMLSEWDNYRHWE